MDLIPTILCGGAGSRLWPISRECHPKPLIRLDDGKSLLQKTFLRAASLPETSEILTVTNREFFFKIEDDLQEVNQKELATSFILEPFGRNTAAAITAAALYLTERTGKDTMLLILPADHLIEDQAEFQRAVFEARELALKGKLITFGIQPDQPHTGFGYIEAEGNEVLRFIEKPSVEKAQEFFESKRFFWNSGMFLFTAKTFLEAMEGYASDILLAMKDCISNSRNLQAEQTSRLELDPKTFMEVPDISIDYAVMEKSKEVAVVPSSMGWTDVGSWNVMSSLRPEDNKGNRITGEVFLHDVENCYIQGNDRVVGGVGLRNLIVVDTTDALLIADTTSAQEVKQIYSQLKTKGHETHKFHRTVYRPWGSFTTLEESKHYKIKRITVKPGACLSLQMHHHRSEHWVVVKGMAKVTNGEKVFLLNINESTYIPAGHKHRLENPGLLDLTLIEVQSGEYLGEDDIVRFEDNYGRV